MSPVVFMKADFSREELTWQVDLWLQCLPQ